jgi:hypothetical protein
MLGRAKRNQFQSRPNALRVEPLEDRDLLSALSPLPGKPGALYAANSAGIDRHTLVYRDGPGNLETTPDSKEYVISYPKSASNQEAQQEYSQAHADRPNDALVATTVRQAQAGIAERRRESIGQPAIEGRTGSNDQNVTAGQESPLPRSAGPGLSAAETASVTVSQVSGSHLRGHSPADLLLPSVSSGDVASLEHALLVDPDKPDIRSAAVQEKVVSAPLTNSLVAGIVPVDLAAVERSVDQFFARMDELGSELITAPASAKLAPWLLGAGLTTAAWQLAQWRLTKQPPQSPFTEGDWRNRRLAWLLGLAVLPPGEMP